MRCRVQHAWAAVSDIAERIEALTGGLLLMVSTRANADHGWCIALFGAALRPLPDYMEGWGVGARSWADVLRQAG